jgi:predicted negative regulator of RcsB-dependent stress response
MNPTTNALARFQLPAVLLAPVLFIGLSANPAHAQEDRLRSPEAMQFIEAMRGYLEVIDRFSAIAQDPASSGVAAVLSAGEIFRSRSAEEAINFYNKILPETKNEAVQRAIRIQLAELYKNTNQPDKALEQLRTLITSAPPEPPMPRVPYPPPTATGTPNR